MGILRLFFGRKRKSATPDYYLDSEYSGAGEFEERPETPPVDREYDQSGRAEELEQDNFSAESGAADAAKSNAEESIPNLIRRSRKASRRNTDAQSSNETLRRSAENGGGRQHVQHHFGKSEEENRPVDRNRHWIAVVISSVIAVVFAIVLNDAGAHGKLVAVIAIYIVVAGVLAVVATRTWPGWFSFFWMMVSFFAIWFFLGGWNVLLDPKDYRIPEYGENCGAYRRLVIEGFLHEECKPTDPTSGVPASVKGPAVLTEQSVLVDWTVEAYRAFILENKFRSLDITFSNRSSRPLNTDNILLGLYEVNGPDERPAEAGTHYLIAGSNGDYDARELFDKLDLSASDRDTAIRNFVELHKLYGGKGYYRLGQMYLGNESKPSTDPDYPSAAPAFVNAVTGDYKNVDFIVSDPKNPDFAEAYINMHIALLCDETNALQWRNYIAYVGGLSRSDEQAYQREAAGRLQRSGQRTPGGFRDHCEGETFQKRIQMLTQDAVIWRFLSDNRPWPTFEELIKKLSLPEVEFREWIGLLVSEAVDLYGYDENVYNLYGPRGRYYQYGSQGSQYYRNSPAADSTRPGDPIGRAGPPRGGSTDYGGVETSARDGLPDECVGLPPGAECVTRKGDLACRDRANSQLNLGKAYLSAGNIMEARKYLQLATDIGRQCQADAAREAARLLQSLNLTCEYSETSLARISRDAENNPEGGAIIGLHARQRALAVHGYYDGNIDGKYGPMTRDAVRAFQSAYGFSQTGDLTAIETVYLICSAAEVKDHAPSMNTLGLMYVTGLGVVQNTDAGLTWLKRAEGLGDINAKYNLALIYGTGTVASSYKLCGVPENRQQADAWLVEAANLGHPRARALIEKYGRLQVSDRWEKVADELELDEFHKQRMTAVGEGCRPNP